MSTKIINDPIYGFLRFSQPLLFRLIEHPYFQRLRHIKQMGLAYYVYPGAVHTRFHHSLGACHLMGEALKILKIKGHDIDEITILSAQIAILLHDIGHGPFSHALEHSLIEGVHHEEISISIMEELNHEFSGMLDEAIQIFTKKHPIHFLSQLVSGQLDMDRMDYLNRDSFYSGVSEGVIGYDRILQMIDVRDNELVVEEKGLQSVEKFLIARRMMYWQVYLHKTVLGTELLLSNILKRAKELFHSGQQLICTPTLRYFLYNDFNQISFKENIEILKNFLKLGDDDILASVRMWAESDDEILKNLCKQFLNRKLFKIKLSHNDLTEEFDSFKKQLLFEKKLDEKTIQYNLLYGVTENKTYNSSETIKILLKNNQIVKLTDIENTLITPDIAQSVKRYYLAVNRDFLHY